MIRLPSNPLRQQQEQAAVDLFDVVQVAYRSGEAVEQIELASRQIEKTT
jgi:hypothetical protein